MTTTDDIKLVYELLGHPAFEDMPRPFQIKVIRASEAFGRIIAAKDTQDERTLPELPEEWLMQTLTNDPIIPVKWYCELSNKVEKRQVGRSGDTPRAAVLAALKSIK